jgi:ABC-type phosphate transport system substrate-binding protein
MVGNRRRHFALLAWLVLSICALFAHADKTPDFVLIVNAKNPTKSANRAEIADAFLKKTTRWDDGETIRPVDQKASSEVRKKFSRAVLKRSVAAVRNYWQQRIFSGRGVPPPELDSDEAVVAYVEKHVGAIGYVSGNAKLKSVRVLTIR